MSKSNVELSRRVAEALNARDFDALITYCDPSIELHSVFAAVGGAVYHGHNGLRECFRDMEDTWGDGIRVEPEALFDLGEHTLALSVMHGRGQHSGVQVAMPLASVLRWRDGLIVYWKSYAHRENALSDLGV